MWTIARAQLGRWYEKGEVERRNLHRVSIPVPQLGPPEYERVLELADLERLRPYLQDGLDRLSQDKRWILVQRIVDERGYDDLARELSISEVAVRVRVSRALAQLSRELDQLGVLGDIHQAEELLT